MKLRNSFFVLFLLIGFNQIFAQSYNEIKINNDIQLIHLQDSIYIHKTWHKLEKFGRFPSNGLIIIKNGQAIMVDTPMDNEKTEGLTNYLEDSLNVELVKFIACHYHDDCMGGINFLHKKGVESIANSMTISKCKELNLPLPKVSFTDSLILNFNGEIVECRFFGGGHTFDNITVYMPQKKILFGGCLVKSAQSKNLGNLADAVVAEWAGTVKKLIGKYPDVEIVVPGHGDAGGSALLNHTVELVENQD
jgi:metallo-beta-lactamase class B